MKSENMYHDIKKSMKNFFLKSMKVLTTHRHTCAHTYRILVWMMKQIPEMDSSNGCTVVWTHTKPLNCTLKITGYIGR